MAFEVTVEFDDVKRLEKALKAEPRRAPRVIRTSLLQGINTFSREFAKRRLSGGGLLRLSRRSGTLARSRETTVANASDIGNLFALFRITAPYAASHEAPPPRGVPGGTAGRPIKSSRAGGALAIPVGSARTRAGVSRFKSPRDDPPLRMVVRRGKSPLLVRDVKGPKGQDIRSDIRWVLKKSVKLKPRLGLLDEWKRYFPTYVQKIQDALLSIIRRKL